MSRRPFLPIASTALCLLIAACSGAGGGEGMRGESQDTSGLAAISAQDTTVAPIDSTKNAASTGTEDPVAQYLASLPRASETLRQEEQSEDARAWRPFFERTQDSPTLLTPTGRSRPGRNSALESDRGEFKQTEDYSQPDVRALLARPLLLNGRSVKVVYDPSANATIGTATCEGTDPVILLASKPSARMSAYAVVFFREHEFAHLTLGHINCAKHQRYRTGGRSQELDADCAAAKVIMEYKDGQRVLDWTAGNFQGLGIKESSSHPATAERAVHITNDCS